MSKSFEAEILSVKEVFSGDKRYIVPNYQRPYAWRREEAERLFNDLWDKFRNNSEEEYFLNNIFLISNSGNGFDIVDGQQRLTTLTMLLALLRHKLADDKEIYTELDKTILWSNEPRLRLRTKDKRFFRTYIQEGKIDDLLKMNEDGLGIDTPAQKHILENAKSLQRKIEAIADIEELKLFTRYNLEKALFAAISANDILSGHEIFDRINASGLPLNAADILKAFFLGRITDETKQEEYVTLWEEWENKTAPDFLNLLGYIRLIITRKNSAGLVKDFKNGKELREISPENFIDSYLEPYARLYLILRDNNYPSAETDCAKNIEHSLHWLGMMWDLQGLSYWIPAAMQFLRLYGNDAKSTAHFLKLLESWVTITFLGSKRAGIGNPFFYNYIWDALGNNCDLDALERKIWRDLEDWGYLANFTRYIDGNVYGEMPNARKKYLMLRLNGLVSRGLPPIPDDYSIEHILPQTVDEDSGDIYFIAKVKQDRKIKYVSAETEGAIRVVPFIACWANKAERENWRNRLANLVLLDRAQNSWASNRDFAVKKQVYFSYGQACRFPLTSEVLNEMEWTPQIVKERQDRLVGLLCEAYGINNWKELREQDGE